MTTLKIRLEYLSPKILKRAIGINLEALPITNKRAKAENIVVKKIYYFTAHFVAREDKTEFACVLIPAPGYRVRFPGYPKDAGTRVAWEAKKANADYFRKRKFWIEEAS